VLQDVFVGIDVSKGRLDVHVRPLGVGFSVSNEAAGYAALIARLRPLRVKRIVLEATGGYERALWLALNARPDWSRRWSTRGRCAGSYFGAEFPRAGRSLTK